MDFIIALQKFAIESHFRHQAIRLYHHFLIFPLLLEFNQPNYLKSNLQDQPINS
jgi:hypothetical protein